MRLEAGGSGAWKTLRRFDYSVLMFDYFVLIFDYCVYVCLLSFTVLLVLFMFTYSLLL